ncbi:MAG: pilus assembly protein TadG-related protein, partial [Geminicoccaceae bacterium]
MAKTLSSARDSIREKSVALHHDRRDHSGSVTKVTTSHYADWRNGFGRLVARWPRDRRGATSLIFAVSATIFFGFAALATEGGSWYLARRNAQNAA